MVKKVQKKPKAKAKPLTGSMKRPASIKDKDDKDVGKINKTIAELQEGLTDCDEEQRDKGKALKYKKLKDSGALPEHVTHLIEVESKKASSSRQFKSWAINRLFSRAADGQLVLNLQDGLFQESQQVFSSTFRKENDKIMPKSILKGLYFGNNEQAFQAALDAGDIGEVLEGDKVMFSFREYRKKDAKNISHQMNRSTKLDKKDRAFVRFAREECGAQGLWRFQNSYRSAAKFQNPQIFRNHRPGSVGKSLGFKAPDL